jgi:uncharacterized membrane protein
LAGLGGSKSPAQVVVIYTEALAMELLDRILYPLTRWLHIVCATLILGGTLFFELVLPIATEDLRNEQRFYAFARARLVFRWVVWISVAGLLISGCLTVFRMWSTYYSETSFTYISRWAMAHVIVGLAAMVIALLLTLGKRPPEDPVRWMRLNLVILLVVLFLGSATRYFQMAMAERRNTTGLAPPPSMPQTQPSEAK